MCDVKNGPGKFEGEPCYAEELYDMWMNGDFDDCPDQDDCYIFIVDDEFREKHELDDSVYEIHMWESDYGFFNTAIP